MARVGRTKFVETDEIFDVELFKNIEINENFILQTFNNAETACTFLARCPLIKNSFYCTVCNSMRPMRLVKRAVLVDGFIWNCIKPCTASKSVRSGSIFEKSKLSFWKIIRMIYKYINRVSFLDIANDLDIDRKTASI
jgi:hypothetical protein